MSFRFKQFFIEDSRCAMKVGTDGVLLGAWASIPNYQSPISSLKILDVGTGSGLIARMLMQRYPEAQVEGIDIDEAAVEQARENGVNAYCARLQDWPNLQSPISNIKSQISNIKYDLIVSNPPYFQNSLKNPDAGRKTARHTDTLSYGELMKHSARLLGTDGQLAIILPAEAEAEVRALAKQHNLHCLRATRVQSKQGKPPKRVLLAFAKGPISDLPPVTEDALVLEDEKGGRSLPYQNLCQEFYL